MTPSEYVRFIDIDVMDYAKLFVKNNEEVSIAKDDVSLLPQELDSEDFKFWTIISNVKQEPIGGLLVRIDEQIAHLVQLMIFPEFRNKKFAQKSVLLLEERLREKNIDQIRLNVLEKNNIALYLFDKLEYYEGKIANCNIELYKYL